MVLEDVLHVKRCYFFLIRLLFKGLLLLTSVLQLGVQYGYLTQVAIFLEQRNEL